MAAINYYEKYNFFFHLKFFETVQLRENILSKQKSEK